MRASLLKRLHAPRAGDISGSWRLLIAGIVTALLIGATGAYASRSVQTGTPPAASPVASPNASPVAVDLGPSTQIIVGEITIEIVDEAIIPAHFESAVGRDVTINIVNAGTRPHNFTIEEFEIDVDLEPGETATVEIEQPELGNYRYYSNLPGDEDLEGTMTVFI